MGERARKTALSPLLSSLSLSISREPENYILCNSFLLSWYTYKLRLFKDLRIFETYDEAHTRQRIALDAAVNKVVVNKLQK